MMDTKEHWEERYFFLCVGIMSDEEREEILERHGGDHKNAHRFVSVEYSDKLLEASKKRFYAYVDTHEITIEEAEKLLKVFHGDYNALLHRMYSVNIDAKEVKPKPLYSPEEIKIEVDKETARRMAPPREDKLWEKIFGGAVAVITFVLLVIGFIIFILMNTYL